MGYITSHWINRTDGGGRTGHTLVHVDLVAAKPTSQFSKDHGLVLRLVAAKRHSHEQQVVHFDERDLTDLVEVALPQIDPRGRAELIAKLLAQMSDADLLAALNGEIEKRYPRLAAE